jgi:hypothetical protein
MLVRIGQMYTPQYVKFRSTLGLVAGDTKIAHNMYSSFLQYLQLLFESFSNIANI